MADRFILTPFFLDRHDEGLLTLDTAEWKINHPLLPKGSEETRIVGLLRPLANQVADALLAGNRPVSVAGDCVSSLGVLAGLQRSGISPTLIWLDAHGDFNTPETTPSGFLGGMPLAMLVGRGDQTLVEKVGLAPLPERQVILSDGRDLDPGEAEALAGSDVRLVQPLEALLDTPLPDGPLYVHFDTDVVDPSEAPAMNYPVPGGPSVSTVRRVFEHLAATERVVAVSMSTWSSALDTDGRSRDTCMSLLRAVL